MKNNWRLKPDDRIGCRVVFYHGRTNRRFVPYSPPGARLTSNRFIIAGRCVVGMAYWVDYWVGCLPSRRAVAFESNNRLTVFPTSIRDISSPHRASIWPWPDTRVIYQVVPGLVSRWRRGGMHAALVSSWCRSGILGWTPGRRRHAPHAKETDVVSSRMTGRRQSESW